MGGFIVVIALALLVVDLLLFIGLGYFDQLLLFTFGIVDCGISLALGGQNQSPPLPLRAHSLLHGAEKS